MIFQKYENIKFAYRDRVFWYRGYYVDTVDKNIDVIKKINNRSVKAGRGYRLAKYI